MCIRDSYSSKVQKFYNGSPNLYRMNCVEAAGEFAKVIFNAPIAHINKYDAAFTNNSLILNASFSHYNLSISKFSAYLSAGRGIEKDGSNGA